jgi:uncharacterized protein
VAPQVRTVAAALVGALLAMPALAQNRPSFDCAKATTSHERTICGSAKLSQADREMAAAYTALANRITGPANAHLAASQRRWIADWRGCDGNPPGTEDCLEQRYNGRMAELKLFREEAYPFISDHAIVASGMGYSVDASYPQFDGVSVDFGAVNRRFVDGTRQIVDDFMTSSPSGTLEQNFDLYRPAPDLISILLRRTWWTAHLVISIKGTLVDLRTARVLGLGEIFLPDSDLAAVVAAAVRKEFADSGRGTPPDDLAGKIGTLGAANFIFDADSVSVTLPELALAQAMKAYLVDIPYADLKSLIRPDGPLARLR